MGRKNQGLFNFLTERPWWFSVITAAVTYIALAWILPSIQFESPFYKGFASALPNMAGYTAFILLLPAPISAFNSWRKRQLLDKQKGIESIRSLSWREFEEIVAEVFRRKGYSVAENTSLGSDGGIDVALKKNGDLTIVQCKQWRTQKVGVSVVREMYGVMVASQAVSVIIITSGLFTQDAQSFATGKPIELIEGSQLASLVKSVQESSDPIQPGEASPDLSTNCPQCGSQLVLRTARRGANAGNKFYGCSSYPACRYTKNS